MTTLPTSPPYDVLEHHSLIGKVLGYSPKMKILDYLLDFPTNDFTKKEIIDALGMSKQTFYKYFDDLKDVGIVKVNRTIGKAKLYKIDSGNMMVKMLVDLERNLSMQIAEQEETKLKKPIPAE